MRAGVCRIAACLAFALSATASFGQDVSARAVATVLLAGDLADLCPRDVARLGPQAPRGFIIAGIRQLEKDGHKIADLNRVSKTMSQRGMNQIKEDMLLRRGIPFKNTRAVCRFARQIAGKNDAIGRFLVRR